MPVRVLITEGTRADCKEAIHLIEGISAETLLVAVQIRRIAIWCTILVRSRVDAIQGKCQSLSHVYYIYQLTNCTCEMEVVVWQDGIDPEFHIKAGIMLE